MPDTRTLKPEYGFMRVSLESSDATFIDTYTDIIVEDTISRDEWSQLEARGIRVAGTSPINDANLAEIKRMMNAINDILGVKRRPLRGG